MRPLFQENRILLWTAVAAAAFLMAAPALRGSAGAPPAIAGEATIEPVESNLAGKPWTAVSASSGVSTAAAAVDGDAATAWVPGGAGAGEWLVLDLGGAYENVRKVEVLFPSTPAIYRYTIEASPDGERWEVIARSTISTPSRRGATHLFTRPGTRYLRATIVEASPGAPAGIAELRAFNYLRDDLVLGADLSFVDGFRDREYFVHPNPARENMGAGPHLFDVVRDRGMEFIRLRVFNEPRNERTGEPRTPPSQGPERTRESARWVKERGMQLGVDFHYADSWADPGKQPKPRAWAGLEFAELVTALHDFTYSYLRSLVEQGTPPDKVAIGNEIINGFLWGSESAEVIAAAGPDATVNPPYFRNEAALYQSRPGGRILWQYWGSDDPEEQRRYAESWDRFATLVAAGISAARKASPETRVELHTIVGLGADGRPGLDKTMEFWHQLLTRVNAKGEDPDVLAISYYPEWHGTVEQLDLNLHTIATTYPQYRVNIAETAYPATGESPQPNSTFPRTVQGQADAIQRVFQAANDVVNNRGVGVLLWEPASFQSMFRPVAGMENTFEPLASIDVFNRSHARRILENRVYLSTRPGTRPNLPPTVQVLDALDGSVGTLPVAWEEVSPASVAGTEVSIEGMTAAGTVTAVVQVIDGGSAAAPAASNGRSASHASP